MERSKRTKAEQEYVKTIIQSLSLRRLTDQEIVDHLHNEKQIEIGRSTVTYIRNNLEKQAEKWYIDLRNSAYKYLAQYKQRIDSLLSYQKALHEIIAVTKREDIKIRAITELHSIEMDILSLWKQLPSSNIVSTIEKEEEGRKKAHWAVQIGGEEEEVKEESEKNPEAWTVDPKPIVSLPDPEPESSAETAEPKQEITTLLEHQSPFFEREKTQKGQLESEPEQKKDTVDIDILGRWPKPFDIEPWVQCSTCSKWLKTEEIRTKHKARYHK